MTAKLKEFFLFGLVWSAVFFAALNWALFEPDNWWSVLISVVYGVGFYIAGSLFGGAEKKSKSKNLGTYYALSAMISSLLIGLVWAVWWQPEQLNFIAYLGVAYLISVIIMMLVRKAKGK